MYRYTTPTYRFSIAGGDLTHCRVWLTLRQGEREVTIEATDTKAEVETDKWTVEITLSQLESAKFQVTAEPLKVQANVMDSNGYRVPTKQLTLKRGSNLLERILAYDRD